MKFKTYRCPLCGGSIQDGLHDHPGHRLRGYGLFVCDNCYDNNWDGWTQDYEDRLLAALDEEEIEYPERNEDGLLPREF